MNRHKLTVTIPSYKQEEMLRRALMSLADQTFKDFLALILDDKSGLDFSKIKNEFADKLNIRIQTNPTNLGAMENMKQSIFIDTNSEYTLSLHEDDYLSIDYIETALEEMDKDNKISFASTRPIWILKDDPYKQFSQSGKEFIKMNASDLVENIIKNEPIMFSSIIYRNLDLVDAWDYKKYNTFCDRVFLTEILSQNKTFAIQFTSPGIAVRDHSKDAHDGRSPNIKFSNFVSLIKYYKNVLRKERKVKSFYDLTRYFLIGAYSFVNLKIK